MAPASGAHLASKYLMFMGTTEPAPEHRLFHAPPSPRKAWPLVRSASSAVVAKSAASTK